MQRVQKGPYDDRARRKDIRVLVAIVGIMVVLAALFTFPFNEPRDAIVTFLAIVILLSALAILGVLEIRRIPAQSRKYPIYEHSTNWTTRLYILIGTTEKHDLQIVKHRWSGKLEVSVDGKVQGVDEPLSPKKGFSIGFRIGTHEVHDIEIRSNRSGYSGIAVIIDGDVDYVF